ncbi:unnamed protein product [Adineta steineri]|uniref:Hydantoinase n=1 Tax=Adineta steineri TaxID=433720 RepID=A0A814ZHV6_9BILA|nr:unnamed protein product [Adineta steineri]CAF1243332.1 unnamed protein product [Adineta steineri]
MTIHVVGVDVGGTNTDAVLLRIDSHHAPKVITSTKMVTSSDVFSGMLNAVQQVIKGVDVTAIMVGTTHFINALIQRRGLMKVCTIRLCGTATQAVPPMANWPQDLKEIIDGLTVFVAGGYLFDGSEISSLDEEEIRTVVRRALALNICTFCVCGVFSPCRSDQEKRVGEIIREESNTAYITLSHEIAGLSLSERENASILNACLRPLATQTIVALQKALPPNIPFFLTKNSGTLLSAEDAIRWPVFTFVSGPTNSMIGAAYLSGIKNGIVIDVGGTSLDIGVLVDGRPRQTHANVKLTDNIRVNVALADTISVTLGGGTIIHVNEKDESVQIGPDSVGYRLEQEALAFGGQTITCTDIALAAGLTTGIGHTSVKISTSIVQQVLDYIKQLVIKNVDRIKTNSEPVPIILCGGGSILIDTNQSIPDVIQIVRPDHFAVCNAIGAALCSLSTTIDSIVDLFPSSVDGGEQRKNMLDQLTREAYEQCEQHGARPNTIYLAELEETPLAYIPGGHRHRVQLTAIGQLDLNKLKQNKQETQIQKCFVDIKHEVSPNVKPLISINLKEKQPVFDNDGFWCIDAIDIEYIAYGAGILGCGGGGESYHFKLWCLELLREGKYKMRVAPPSFFSSSSDLVVDVGYMGAPTVTHELLSNGHECLDAVNNIEKYLGKKVNAVYSGEIGGSNGLMGLLVSAKKKVPCIDCDSMGRAFPCLTHILPFIHNLPATPACLCDVRDQTFMCTDDMVSTPQELEDTFREECIKRGLYVGVCLPPISGEQLQKHTVHHSLSRAWFLGEAKFNHQIDAIQAVASAGHGRILISDGTVINVERHTTDGFARGHVSIKTAERILIIDFQNENLIARFDNGEIVASVPDLIVLVEQDTAEPLATEVVKYGYRVSVLVLPAPEALTTPHALQYVGLKAFGYDFPDYKYIPSYASIQSVWDVYYKKDFNSQQETKHID